MAVNQERNHVVNTQFLITVDYYHISRSINQSMRSFKVVCYVYSRHPNSSPRSEDHLHKTKTYRHILDNEPMKTLGLVSQA